MVVYCCVCKSKGEKGFFRYPTGSQRAECLRISGLPPEPELKVKIGGLRICFRHFQANDLIVVNGKVRLRTGKTSKFDIITIIYGRRNEFILIRKVVSIAWRSVEKMDLQRENHPKLKPWMQKKPLNPLLGGQPWIGWKWNCRERSRSFDRVLRRI